MKVSKIGTHLVMKQLFKKVKVCVPKKANKKLGTQLHLCLSHENKIFYSYLMINEAVYNMVR